MPPFPCRLGSERLNSKRRRFDQGLHPRLHVPARYLAHARRTRRLLHRRSENFEGNKFHNDGHELTNALETGKNQQLPEIMDTLPLQLRDGHPFVELNGELWLLDTGAPTSFGKSTSISLAGEQFSLGSSYLGLTSATLAGFVGVQCVGLLGADVLGRFDHILDVPGGTLSISTAELSHAGQTVRLADFMGIPILTAQIAGTDYRMFFDTGAQISYFQEDSIADFPAAGPVTDFYPGVGQFQTETHQVEVTLGGVAFKLRCGTLPGLLGATLMMADTEGIVGNQILCNRVVGYFPRRHALVISALGRLNTISMKAS